MPVRASRVIVLLLSIVALTRPSIVAQTSRIVTHLDKLDRIDVLTAACVCTSVGNGPTAPKVQASRSSKR